MVFTKMFLPFPFLDFPYILLPTKLPERCIYFIEFSQNYHIISSFLLFAVTAIYKARKTQKPMYSSWQGLQTTLHIHCYFKGDFKKWNEWMVGNIECHQKMHLVFLGPTITVFLVCLGSILHPRKRKEDETGRMRFWVSCIYHINEQTIPPTFTQDEW